MKMKYVLIGAFFLVFALIPSYVHATLFNITAYNEDTLQKIPYQVILDDTHNNFTETRITGYTNMSNCYRDFSNGTDCSMITGITGTESYYIGSLGIDYNNATINSSIRCDAVGGGMTGTISIVANTSAGVQFTLDYIGCANSKDQHDRVLTINNSDGIWNKVIDLYEVITTNMVGSQQAIMEFNMLTPYNYSLDGNTTTVNLSNSTTYLAYFKGAEGINDATTEYSSITTRMYSISVQNESVYILSAYLLPYSGTNYLQFFTVLDANNIPISDALITISKFYAGNETIVAQGLSNPAGSASVFVKPSTSYSTLISATGFYDKQQSATNYNGLPNPLLVYLNSINLTNLSLPTPYNMSVWYLSGVYFAISPAFSVIRYSGSSTAISVTYGDSFNLTYNATINVTRRPFGGNLSDYYYQSICNNASPPLFIDYSSPNTFDGGVITPANAYDEDWTTLASIPPGGSGNVYENVTFNNQNLGTFSCNWTAQRLNENLAPNNISIFYWNNDISNWSMLNNSIVSAVAVNTTMPIPNDGIFNNTVQIKTYLQKAPAGGGVYYYEGALNCSFTNCSKQLNYQNFTISIGLNDVASFYNVYYCMFRNGSVTDIVTHEYCTEAFYSYLNISNMSWANLNATAGEAAGGASVYFWKIIAFFMILAATAYAWNAVGQGAILIPPMGFLICGVFSVLSIGEAFILGVISIFIAIKVLS